MSSTASPGGEPTVPFTPETKPAYPPPSPVPTQAGPLGIRFDFNLGARVLLPEGHWRVRLMDADTGNILFESENRGALVSSSKRWFVRLRLDGCNGCWNDPAVRFDHKDFLWCPRHKDTPRHFECTRLITSEHVTRTIGKIPGFGAYLTQAAAPRARHEAALP